MTFSPSAVLIGPASIDRWITGDTVEVLPGGGALNMAFHWARRGMPGVLVTRIGEDRAALFRAFLHRHGIAYVATSLVAEGATASIDVEIRDDRQPWMDNFVEGVWHSFALTDAECAAMAGAGRVHAVLVDPVVAEVERLGETGLLDGVEVSADFLSFRHYDLDRFARTLAHVDLAFVGWPGERSDGTVEGIVRQVRDAGKRAVLTFGAAGILVVDDTGERWEQVDAVPVQGTTIGCGDAFIAAFLAEMWADAVGDDPWESRLDSALAAGRRAGARTTTHVRPLPDDAYG